MFWKKTVSPLNSDEYDQLTKKNIAMASDLLDLNNRFAILDSICKSNRARIGKIKIEEIMAESEKDLNNDPKYI